jgi:hypothetical protein
MQIERRTNLQGGTQIRHALARAIVAARHRNGCIHADVQFGKGAIKKLAAHAIAIRLKKVASVHEVRHRDWIHVTLIGTAIIWK